MLKLAQLSRRRDARLPRGFRSVARPGPLANPFRSTDGAYAVKAFTLYARAAVFNERFGWATVARLPGGEPTQYDLPKLVRIGWRELADSLGIVGDFTGKECFGNFKAADGFEEPVAMVQKPDLAKFKTAFLTLADASGIACWCRVGEICHAPIIRDLWEEFTKRSTLGTLP